MRGCVVVGVWGAGKTTVYQAVLTRLVAAGCESLIAMPQAATLTTHTYTDSDPAKQAEAMVEWIEHLTTFLCDVDRRFRTSTLPRHRFAAEWTPTCLLEGLGFDIAVYDLPVSRARLLDSERRMADSGLELVVLRVPPQRILHRCLRSTRTVRGPKWAAYVDGFGSTEQQRVDHIARAQDRLLRWVESSPMPSHIIDAGADDLAPAVAFVTELITSSQVTTRD
ncbi:hypothetical protein [Nocardia sp. NPDC047038]|uniref:hypothetical protein n=1 Tax=Nocardia sp. NPDC047038 TaxID=3154338 RepID=UPI0033E0AA33